MQMSDLKKVSDVYKDRKVNILIYGKAGVGKTPLITQADNPIILSIEKGLKSISNSNLPMYETQDFDKIIDFMKWWSSSTEAKQFETLCIDSLSELSYVALKSLSKKYSGFAIYNELYKSVFSIVSYLHDIDERNVVCTAKLGQSKDEDDNVIMRPVFEGNKLESVIPHKFDCILFVNEDGIMTKPSHSYLARDRTCRLDEEEPKDLKLIFDKIKGRK